jgi:hypothetical protein
MKSRKGKVKVRDERKEKTGTITLHDISSS